MEKKYQEAASVAYGRGYISYENFQRVMGLKGIEMDLSEALKRGNSDVPGGQPPIQGWAATPERIGTWIPDE